MRDTIYLTKYNKTLEIHRTVPKMFWDGSVGSIEDTGADVNDTCTEDDALNIFPEIQDDEVYEYKLVRVIKKSDLEQYET